MLTKTCKGCLIEKSIDNFGKHKIGLNGLRSRCRACRKIEAAEANSRPDIKIQNYNRKVKWRRENEEQYKAVDKAWRLANPDKTKKSSNTWKAKNRKATRTYAKEYAKEHRAERTAAQNLRYTRSLQRTPVWSEVLKIKELYAEASRLRMQVDHIIPLQGDLVSGLHVLGNLQLLSPFDNISKKNKYVIS